MDTIVDHSNNDDMNPDNSNEESYTIIVNTINGQFVIPNYKLMSNAEIHKELNIILNLYR